MTIIFSSGQIRSDAKKKKYIYRGDKTMKKMRKKVPTVVGSVRASEYRR